MVRYRYRAMTIKDREDWVHFKANLTTKLTQPQYKLLCTLHARYYKHKYYEPCSCRPKEIVMWIKDIDNLYNK